MAHPSTVGRLPFGTWPLTSAWPLLCTPSKYIPTVRTKYCSVPFRPTGRAGRQAANQRQRQLRFKKENKAKQKYISPTQQWLAALPIKSSAVPQRSGASAAAWGGGAAFPR
ncbi:hypothetical protein LZ31DRAFT_261728 [Colletotrichum somersetense]|nr:hypothetical protein LZ31DRAFT_261728 [Colletotrichum somersetense]